MIGVVFCASMVLLSLTLKFKLGLYTRRCYVQKEFSKYGCIFEKFSSWIPLLKENYFFYLSHFGRFTSYKYSCHALQNYNSQSSVRSALIATCCGQYCRNIILPYRNQTTSLVSHLNIRHIGNSFQILNSDIYFYLPKRISWKPKSHIVLL